MIRIATLTLLTAFIVASCSAQQKAVKKYDVYQVLPKQQYLEDVTQLVDSIRLLHPQLYEFQTKESFDRLVSQKKATITSTTTVGEFVWLCNSITAAVGCGHTNASVENTLNLSPALFFPVEARYFGTKLTVVNPLVYKGKIKQGAELVSINGVPADSLYQLLSNAIPADGYNQSFRNMFINSYFVCYVAFHFGFPEEYIVAVNEDGATKTLTLKKGYKKVEEEMQAPKCTDNLCFEIDEANSLAIIKIRSFSYYQTDFPVFEKFIDSCFAQIKQAQTKHLVIDIRDNMGGDPFCASYLLQHIASKPYRYYKKGSTEWYTDLEKMIPPHKNRFVGKPYILTNGWCFSTSGHFSSLIRMHDMGIFVGQETGGTYTCNANNHNFQLKHTGIQIFLATGTYQTEVKGFEKNRGIIPDYIITPNLADIIAHKDLEMEKVYELINK